MLVLTPLSKQVCASCRTIVEDFKQKIETN